MIVRAARASDADDIARIGAATFALACPPNTPKTEIDAYIAAELTPERIRASILGEAQILFVATVQNVVVASMMLSRAAPPKAVCDGPAIELKRIYVLPDFHGMGIAQALMRQCWLSALAAGCRTVWLGVSKYNKRGIAFYRRAGFAVVGEQKFMVGAEAHADYLMACDISAQARLGLGDAALAQA